MKKRKQIRRRLCFFILCFSLLFTSASIVYATEIDEGQMEELLGDDLTNEVDEANEDRFGGSSPWMDNADDSIYSDAIDASEGEQEIDPKDPGIVEKYFAELIRNTASSLISLLEEKMSAGIDRIIYGRVGSGKPNSVNIYAFELRSGNPYGVTASICYALIRSMVFVMLGVSFVFLLAESAWSGQTAQSRERIKSKFYSTAMKFSFLTLMPYLFDVALYVRDVVLYGLKTVNGQLVAGGGQLSLANAFLLNAERTGRFVDALMYLGTVGLTLFFAVIYIAIAIDLLICFIAFPILCLLHTQKRNLLDSWMMTVLSNILTPVLDAILLLIPLLTSVMLADVIKGVAIIQLIMCMLIIPCRIRIKALLGIQSNERGGILGAMAMLTMGRAIAGKARGAFQRMSDIRSDMEKSRMHKELAKEDEEENEALLGGFNQDSGTASRIDTDDMQGGAGRTSEEMDTAETDAGDIEAGGTQPLDEYDAEGEPESMEPHELDVSDTAALEAEDKVSPEEGTAEDSLAEPLEESEADKVRMDAPETMTGEQDQVAAPQTEEEKLAGEALTRNEMLRNLDRSMEEKQNAIDSLRAQKAGYQMEQKRAERELLNHDRGTEEYRELERKRADMALRASETEQRIAGQMQNLNQLKNQAKEIRGSGTGATPTPYDEARAEILCKRANINNFEQPEFRNALSNAQMQKLYLKRAAMNTGKGVAAVGGTLTGAALLGGASVFMQPGTAVMATAVGATAGSAIGSAVVSAGVAGAGYMGKAAQFGSHVISQNKQVVAAEAGTSISFEEAYGQAPLGASGVYYTAPIETPQQRQQRVVSDVLVAGAASSAPAAVSQEPATGSPEILRQKIQIEVEQESAEALQKVLSPAGNLRTSTAIMALERANIETEKYLAILRETNMAEVTRKQAREKRIEFQTKYVTDEVLKKLSLQPDYEKGTEKYQTAETIIHEKVRAIVEERNKDVF